MAKDKKKKDDPRFPSLRDVADEIKKRKERNRKALEELEKSYGYNSDDKKKKKKGKTLIT